MRHAAEQIETIEKPVNSRLMPISVPIA